MEHKPTDHTLSNLDRAIIGAGLAQSRQHAQATVRNLRMLAGGAPLSHDKIRRLIELLREFREEVLK